jgi:prostaglandin-E synthase
MTVSVKHPLILWAQRSPHVYLSAEVEDMEVEELSVDGDTFKVKGKRGDDKYEANLQLFGKLKGDELRKIATSRRVEIVVPKESAEWWPRLLKEKTKVPWIKVDFDKWKDEDEENEETDDFGGMGMGGMGGMGGMPGMGGMGGMDFSSFGMPGGGMSGGGFDDLDLGDDADGDDDEEMGELEDVEEPDDGEGAAKPKGTAAYAKSAGNHIGANGTDDASSTKDQASA